ncbi:MAG: hypothetical protein K9L65_03040 [Chromatiaceae bacterium]|nr:hypothetical protein [Chromatiaceae bacterium]
MMTLHHIDTPRPGYYADLEAFNAWLKEQNAQHARAMALAKPVFDRFPGIPMKFAPVSLLLMGQKQDALELSVAMAYLAAESEAELAPEALSETAHTLLVAYLPDILGPQAERTGRVH